MSEREENHVGARKMDEVERLRATVQTLQEDIGELRRECDNRFTAEEVAAWLSYYGHNYRALTLREWVQQRRTGSGNPG